MATTYDYDKSPVNIQKLKLEILEDETIVKTLNEITYNVGEEPNDLHITFNSALDGGEETALDSLVAAHDGNPPTLYSRYCRCCGSYLEIPGIVVPTTCPCCDMMGCLTDTADMAEVFMRLLIAKQDAEPTIAKDDTGCIWIDTNDSDRVYLVFRRGEADQVKIELT